MKSNWNPFVKRNEEKLRTDLSDNKKTRRSNSLEEFDFVSYLKMLKDSILVILLQFSRYEEEILNFSKSIRLLVFFTASLTFSFNFSMIKAFKEL